MDQKTDNLKEECLTFLAIVFAVVPLVFIIILKLFGINLIYLSLPQNLPLQYFLVYNIAIITLSTVLVKEEERVEKEYEILNNISPTIIPGKNASEIVNKGKKLISRKITYQKRHIKGCLALFLANILGLWIIVYSFVVGKVYWGYYVVYLIIGLAILTIIGFMVMYKTYENFIIENEG